MWKQITEKVKKINELTKARYGFRVQTFTKISDVLPYGRDMFGVLNRAFEELFSVVPFGGDLMDFYIKKYISLLNPNFIKLVFDKEDKLAGFIIGVNYLRGITNLRNTANHDWRNHVFSVTVGYVFGD
jgi:hypothetical protein